MHRKEVILQIQHAGAPTPSREEMRKQYAASEGVSVECVELVFVVTDFGTHTSRAILRVWNTPREELQPTEDAGESEEQTSEGS